MSTASKARRDAREYAAAKMAYGEGAGTRRKLIKAKVDENLADPEYARAFRDEYEHQDMAAHADRARKDRRRRDATDSLTKNAKGLMTGNHNNVSGGVLVIAAVGYAAHQTGLDTYVWEKSKELGRKMKKAFNEARYTKPDSNNVYNITDAKR